MITYKMSEIIFGLREKYQENERVLKKLKEYTKINDDRIKDLSYRFQKTNISSLHLSCDIKMKECRLIQKIEEISKKLGIYCDEENTYPVYKRLNDKCVIPSPYNIYLKDDFSALIKNFLMKNYFGKYMSCDYNILKQKENKYTFSLQVGGIYLRTLKPFHSMVDLNYKGKNDVINLVVHYLEPGLSLANILEDLLNIEIPVYMIDPYSSAIIETTPIKSKQIHLTVSDMEELEYNILLNKENKIIHKEESLKLKRK